MATLILSSKDDVDKLFNIYRYDKNISVIQKDINSTITMLKGPFIDNDLWITKKKKYDVTLPINDDITSTISHNNIVDVAQTPMFIWDIEHQKVWLPHSGNDIIDKRLVDTNTTKYHDIDSFNNFLDNNKVIVYTIHEIHNIIYAKYALLDDANGNGM